MILKNNHSYSYHLSRYKCAKVVQQYFDKIYYGFHKTSVWSLITAYSIAPAACSSILHTDNYKVKNKEMAKLIYVWWYE